MKIAIVLAGSLLALMATVTARAEGPIARVPAVDASSNDPDIKAMFAERAARGGQLINLALIRANAPKLSKPGTALAYAIRYETKTPRSLIELAIFRTAQLWDGEYEINQHTPMMKACGYTPAQIAGLANWRGGGLFDLRQRALLAYVEQAAKGDVDDATFAEFQKHFDTQEIVEVTITVNTYVGTALFTRALRIKVEDDGRLTSIGKCES